MVQLLRLPERPPDAKIDHIADGHAEGEEEGGNAIDVEGIARSVRGRACDN